MPLLPLICWYQLAHTKRRMIFLPCRSKRNQSCWEALFEIVWWIFFGKPLPFIRNFPQRRVQAEKGATVTVEGLQRLDVLQRLLAPTTLSYRSGTLVRSDKCSGTICLQEILFLYITMSGQWNKLEIFLFCNLFGTRANKSHVEYTSSPNCCQ